MRKKTPFILTICLIAVVAVALHRHFCSPVAAACGATPTETFSPDEGITTQLAPRFYEYSVSALQEARQNNFKVVLYFWAPWCSTCASFDIDVEKDPSLIPNNVIVLRINYDKATDLKKQYQIVTQHTFVEIDAQGNSLQQWVGGSSTELRQKVQ